MNDIIDLSPAASHDLAAQINTAVREAEGHAQTAMRCALKAGELLSRAKREVQHGQWESWLAANCAVAPRTAQAYMRLHSKLLALPPVEAQRVADMPVREAVKAIATNPAAPPPRASKWVRVKPTVASRTEVALGQTIKEIGQVKRWIVFGIKRAQISKARAKLQAALAALDQLEADAEVQS